MQGKEQAGTWSVMVCVCVCALSNSIKSHSINRLASLLTSLCCTPAHRSRWSVFPRSSMNIANLIIVVIIITPRPNNMLLSLSLSLGLLPVVERERERETGDCFKWPCLFTLLSSHSQHNSVIHYSSTLDCHLLTPSHCTISFCHSCLLGWVGILQFSEVCN